MSAAREEVRAESEEQAEQRAVADIDAEERSFLAWALVKTKIAQGEGLKETLLWAIRNGARLPDDLEFREWFADVLEGKLAPKRGRGRPRKQQRRDWVHTLVENGIAEVYDGWLAAFQSDRELAWRRAEALRLRREKPNSAAWRRVYDFGTEEGRRSFETALSGLGARPCPPAARRGAETPHELALKATAEERRAVWKRVAGKPLTPSVVARIITRAKNSE
jgi:hypothetical protein